MSDQHERVLHHIDGAWVPSASGRALDNTNPADTRQILGTVVDGDRADTLRAIEAAHAAAPLATRATVATRAPPAKTR